MEVTGAKPVGTCDPLTRKDDVDLHSAQKKVGEECLQLTAVAHKHNKVVFLACH
jgi:hypothetical protein